MDIPEIATERLLLRGPRQTDFEAYAEIVADPQVTRFLSDGKPLSRADAWRQLALLAGHWHLRGFGLWMVEERATGALLGRVGCWEPEGWPALEVAYTLAPHAWGKRYATEAARASLAYARDTLHRADVVSIIRPDNERSIRVATALGARSAEAIEFFGAPAVLYRYP